MADSVTAHLNLVKPEPSGSPDTWGTKTNTNWDTVDGIIHALQLSVATAVGAGMVGYFASNAPPNGWLRANGAAVSRATFATLFAVVGTTYGAGDGVNTFNLPDLRAEFVRGFDDGRGVDVGRVFGSAQTNENKSHTHTATGTADNGGAHVHTGVTDAAGAHSHGYYRGGYSNEYFGTAQTSTIQTEYHTATDVAGSHTHTVTIASGGSHTHALTITVNAAGETESRPRNVAMLACIKY